ncbi:unnamed protein product, partial [Prorocentrum cordatum]
MLCRALRAAGPPRPAPRAAGKSAGLPRVEATASLGRLARLAGAGGGRRRRRGPRGLLGGGAARRLQVAGGAGEGGLRGRLGRADRQSRPPRLQGAACGRPRDAGVGGRGGGRARRQEHAAEGAGEAWARDAPKATTCVRAAGHLSLCVAEASGAIESADWASRRGAAPALRLLGGVELFQGSSAG